MQSGDFIFEIWLGCDSLALMLNLTIGTAISQVWVCICSCHTSAKLRGEVLVEAWGDSPGAVMQPAMEGVGSSTSGRILSSTAEHLIGLQVPPELLPNLSQPGELPLEFVYQACNPQGEWTGAVLSFTLTNKPDGFYLMDIKIQPLSAQELSAQKPQ